ncbi:MAG: gliding motility-associated-like protein [Litorivivens sp.]|jgi:gliding motility-associated-like protein
MKLTYTLILLGSMFLFSTLEAQILIDNSLTVEDYVQNVLIGQGVAVSNITFNGAPGDQVNMQIGSFDGTACNVGIPSGLVLGSGDVSFVEGPNNSGGFTGNSPGNFDTSDPDLTALIPGYTVNDWAILEFDFVPNGDTLSFNYVWGSEEYMEWVNTSFNDVFGFFLSGPGILGPYSNGAINIAQIPGTALPVTIDNVNLGSNPEYYIDNEVEADSQTNDYYIQLDGFTVPLEAMAIVECGGSYHIKIAIADAGDTILDSAVFLEEGSFSSNSVVEVDLSVDVGLPGANIIYEDCGLATISFTRSPLSDLSVEDMVIVTWGGSAINGVDYTQMQDTIIFPIGEVTVQFEIDAFEDGIAEGLENVFLDILNLAACNGAGLVTNYEFFIDNEPELLVVDGFSETICLGDTLEIAPIITGGYGNYQYLWSTTETTPSIFTSPLVTTTYNIIVSDTCGMPSDDADITVEIIEYPALEVVIDQGDLDLDCGESINLTATASGGDGVYSNWAWTDENGINLFGWDNNLWYSTWQGASQINISVQDGCGFIANNVINVSLDVPPLLLDAPDEILALCNEDFNISAQASGGQPVYSYNWYIGSTWQGFGSDFTYSTSQEIVITVDAQDACGQSLSVDIPVFIDSPPVLTTLQEFFTGSCIEEFSIHVDVISGSGGYQFTWYEDGIQIASGTPLIATFDDSTNLTVVVEDACDAQTSDETEITIINPPLEIDLGEDLNASCIDNTQLFVDIISGSGAYTYMWFIDGNQVGSDSTITWQTYTSEEVTVIVADGCQGLDEDVIVLNIPNEPVVVDVTPPQFICAGEEVTLEATAVGGEGGFIYYWPEMNEWGQSVTFSPFQAGEFTVVATDICNKYDVDSTTVQIIDLLAQFQTVYLDEFNVQFYATPAPTCPDCNYLWDFGDGFSSTETDPFHTFDGLAQYDVELVVVHPAGCIDTALGIIHAPPILYIPNSFTPNNDGVNDYFSVIGDQLLRFELNIFNRWGDLVFHSTDITQAWNGSCNGGEHFSPNGVYQYQVKVKGFNSDAIEKNGTVTLLR